jgi:hypothetical protein
MDQGSQYQTQNSAVSTGKSREYSGSKGIGKDFLNRTPAAQQLKRKGRQMGLHKIKKLLHNKRNGL